MKVLVVEDDATVAQAIEALLVSHHYAVDIAIDGLEGLEMAEVYSYDLMLLDIGLPGMDGVSLCQQLRSRGLQTPILLLTGQDVEAHAKAVALNAGADDYVTKPFDTEELLARLQTLLRRGSLKALPVLQWGALSLDPSRLQVSYGKTLLNLTPKEYALLEVLLRHAPNILTARAILEQGWNALENPGDEAIRTHIKEIRKKLKAAGAPEDFIKTAHRQGYRLNPLYGEAAFTAPNEAAGTLQMAELKAINEELRKTLEQLQTTQADLRQSNQDLQAARDELEARVAARTAALSQREAFLSNIYEGANQSIFVVAVTATGDFRYVSLNHSAQEATGIALEEFRNKTPEEIFGPEVGAQFRQNYERCVRAKHSMVYEEQFTFRGRPTWTLTTLSPLHDATGRVDRLVGTVLDVTDRKLIEIHRAEDLEALELLRSLSTRFVSNGDLQGLYEEILIVAIQLMRADGGTLQIFDPAAQELMLLASVGFDRAMTEHFNRVGAASNTPCGRALATGQRTFVEFDEPTSADPDESLRLHREVGYLSAQSTPLISRLGNAIGMVSTHWRSRHQASDLRSNSQRDRDLWFLDLLARQAADLIEQRQIHLALHQSEEKFRLFVAASSNAVYRMSADWQEMRRLEGKDFLLSTEAPTRTWLDTYIPPAEQPRVWAAIQQAIRTKRFFELEHQAICRDGSIGWISSRALPLLNEQGEIVEWLGAASDISDRKRTEANLALLANIAEDFSQLSTADEIMRAVGAKVGAYLNITSCLFVEINDAQDQAIVRYSWQTADTPNLTGVYRLSAFISDHLRQAARAGETIVIRNTQSDPRVDSVRHAAARIQAFVTIPFLRDGVWKYVFTVNDSAARSWRDDEVELIREVTHRTFPRLERAKAEAALHSLERQRVVDMQALNETLEQMVQLRTAQLEALNQELDAFSSAVSHDLQTPLRHILSFVERLRERLAASPMDDSSQRYLSIIEQAAEQAHQMVADLLEFSRLGTIPLRRTQVSLAQLVQQVRSQLEPEIAGRDIEWQVEPLPAVEGDRDMLRLVVQNLLSNAIKYSRDRAPAHITVGSQTRDQDIVFFVQDNGAGFDMQYHDRLFTLFQRLHSQDEFAGNGVGLANVRRIIHRHGGQVWAEGAVGQGATIYVSLPRAGVAL